MQFTLQIHRTQTKDHSLIFFRRISVEVFSGLVLLSDDVLHQRQQTVDVSLLTVMELQMWQWALHGLWERLSNSFYVLIKKPHQALQTWRTKYLLVLHWRGTNNINFTFITLSGVMSFISFCGDDVCEGETRTVFPCFASALVVFSRGRVFLKILTMSRLMGNMMIELWTPMITCCQVNSMWPAKLKSYFELGFNEHWWKIKSFYVGLTYSCYQIFCKKSIRYSSFRLHVCKICKSCQFWRCIDLKVRKCAIKEKLLILKTKCKSKQTSEQSNLGPNHKKSEDGATNMQQSYRQTRHRWGLDVWESF